MKHAFLIAALFFGGKIATAQTSWMNHVLTWNVKITLSYVDSINAGNYTRLNYVATGIIKDEVRPAGTHIVWPMTMNFTEMAQLRAVGQYITKVTEDAPPVMRVQEYTCTAEFDELVLGSIGVAINGKKYAVSVSPPTMNTLTCSGKGFPDKAEWDNFSKSIDYNPDPEDNTFIGGDPGPSSKILTGNTKYKTSSGATVTMSWMFQPMARD